MYIHTSRSHMQRSWWQLLIRRMHSKDKRVNYEKTKTKNNSKKCKEIEDAGLYNRRDSSNDNKNNSNKNTSVNTTTLKEGLDRQRRRISVVAARVDHCYKNTNQQQQKKGTNNSKKGGVKFGPAQTQFHTLKLFGGTFFLAGYKYWMSA
ncbi:unnamed protein product [Ceratitis capitata]|uniref:(Mediterranean fruit fly) hypothetical protein n=1 Tax=Ceratitis capitata TaxID=7213 RepID=A0A811U4R1_CERCA|nr:unnamed protein product [Ceratitis capitata]